MRHYAVLASICIRSRSDQGSDLQKCTRTIFAASITVPGTVLYVDCRLSILLVDRRDLFIRFSLGLIDNNNRPEYPVEIKEEFLVEICFLPSFL